MTKQQIIHAVGIALVIGSSAAISVLTGSSWHWAPVALAVITDLRVAFGVQPAVKP